MDKCKDADLGGGVGGFAAQVEGGSEEGAEGVGGEGCGGQDEILWGGREGWELAVNAKTVGYKATIQFFPCNLLDICLLDIYLYLQIAVINKVWQITI